METVKFFFYFLFKTNFKISTTNPLTSLTNTSPRRNPKWLFRFRFLTRYILENIFYHHPFLRVCVNARYFACLYFRK